MSAFYEGLAEILETGVEKINRDLRLEEAMWNSLAIVSTIALIDEVYDKTVSADALAECKTVGDIEKLTGGAGSGQG